jgi:hypothetical protein
MENNYFIRGNSIYKNDQLLCNFEEKTIWDGKKNINIIYYLPDRISGAYRSKNEILNNIKRIVKNTR